MLSRKYGKGLQVKSPCLRRIDGKGLLAKSPSVRKVSLDPDGGGEGREFGGVNRTFASSGDGFQNIWHDVVPAVLDDGMTAVTMGCGPSSVQRCFLALVFFPTLTSYGGSKTYVSSSTWPLPFGVVGVTCP